MRKMLWSCVAVLGAACSSITTQSTPGAGEPPAATVIVGGRVWGQPEGTAIVTVGNRIDFVGPEREARERAGSAAAILEARGGYVVPGLHDAHVHMLGAGLQMSRVQLAEAKTLEEALALVASWAAANPSEPWVQGRGWSYDIVPAGKFPTRHDLDRVVPDRPVFLRAYDGHSGWANSKALELAGLTAASKDPEAGKIVREADGKTPQGALLENAMMLVMDVIPKPSREAKLEAFAKAIDDCIKHGVTSIDDITADTEALELYAELEKRGQLKARLTVSPPLDGDLALYAELRERYASPFLRFGFLKGFVDGVFESRTAFVLEPYPDSHEHGLPELPADKLDPLVEKAHAAGFPVALHAIGDAAVRISLDAFERAAKAHPDKVLRHRIEHIEVVDPADMPRFAQLGVVASMQPLHADPMGPTPGEGVYSKNVGAKRIAHNFAWRELEQAGAVLAFGSDWPVMSQNPLWGLAMALTRRTAEGEPEGGWNAQQTVSIDSALRAYTYGAAYGISREAELGSLAPGQLADIVVFSPAVQWDQPATLWSGEVQHVMVDGVVRYGGQGAGAVVSASR